MFVSTNSNCKTINKLTFSMKKLLILLLIWSILPVIAQSNKDFNNYISHFMPCEQKEFNAYFFSKDSVEINKNTVSKYLPKKLNCNCTTKGLWYRYGRRIPSNKYVIVFVSKLCDIPHINEYPYAEDVLLVYSKTGKLIDFETISHGSDIHAVEFFGTIHPFKIIVEQGVMNNPNDMNKVESPHCTIQIYEYTIGENGKINKRIVQKNISGRMVYSKERIFCKFITNCLTE